MDIKALVEQTHPQVVAWRRHLHQHPETSWDEVETTAWLAERLSEMGLAPRRERPTGLFVDITGGKAGPRLALRADIDALAVEEATGLPYCSQTFGKMHACGHDAHMAMLLGAAAVFAEHREALAGDVRLIFQAAEETPPPGVTGRDFGGSVEMVNAGAMEGVDRVVGIHIFSDIPVGHIALLGGPFMAGSLTFDIEVIGKGGHAGMPEGTVDALAVGAHIVAALQSAKSLGADPTEPLIVHVGRFHAGTARTAVAATAELQGTIRFTNAAKLEQIKGKIAGVGEQVAAAFGATATVAFDSAPNLPIVNDHGVIEALRSSAETVVGREGVVPARVTMASEDFWAYLQKAPGAFVPIGGGNQAKGITAGHHSPQFDIDEDGMKTGLELWLRLGFVGLG
jgi:amidohydrolase